MADLAWRPLRLDAHGTAVPEDEAQIALSEHGGLVLSLLQPRWTLRNVRHTDAFEWGEARYTVGDVCLHTFGDAWLEFRHGTWRPVPGSVEGFQVCREAVPGTYALRRKQAGQWVYSCMLHALETRKPNRVRIRGFAASGRVSVGFVRLVVFGEEAFAPGMVEARVRRRDGNPANDCLENLVWRAREL